MEKEIRKLPEAMEWVGEPPRPPTDFWGDVVIRYQAGKAIVVEVRQTASLRQP